MKWFKYIWRNVLRNKVRSMLTLLSICFSLALMTILYGYINMQDLWGREAQKHHRVVVMNIQGFSGMLPIAYVDRIRSTEGVKAAVPYSWFGGNYKEEQMPFAQFGTDPGSVFDVWDDFSIPSEQLEQWRKNRQGCVVDRRLAARRGWKIGERIPIQGTIYPVSLDLELVGIFDTPQNTDSLWFNWYYLDEQLKQLASRGAGNAGTIFAKTASKESVPLVSRSIDERFASSDNPTRTQSESAFAQMFTDMLGNLQAYIRFIGLVVVFSLCLVAGNSMGMSMRERTTEIAVLKAIGFSASRVLNMVLAESTTIALLGGILGIGLGCGCLQVLHGISPQFFPLSMREMAGMWILYLVIIAGGIGLLSGMFPAIRASRLSVVDGLRRVI